MLDDVGSSEESSLKPLLSAFPSIGKQGYFFAIGKASREEPTS
jgi:hypothetical protein